MCTNFIILPFVIAISHWKVLNAAHEIQIVPTVKVNLFLQHIMHRNQSSGRVLISVTGKNCIYLQKVREKETYTEFV